ncbi:unnamed protein product, partial [Sphacelaria rigidula]
MFLRLSRQSLLGMVVAAGLIIPSRCILLRGVTLSRLRLSPNITVSRRRSVVFSPHSSNSCSLSGYNGRSSDGISGCIKNSTNSLHNDRASRYGRTLSAVASAQTPPSRRRRGDLTANASSVEGSDSHTTT